jgi:hypothetical protein
MVFLVMMEIVDEDFFHYSQGCQLEVLVSTVALRYVASKIRQCHELIRRVRQVPIFVFIKRSIRGDIGVFPPKMPLGKITIFYSSDGKITKHK